MAELSNVERIAKARRLHWLCGEMIVRMEEEENPREIGNIAFSLTEEAASLAESLGFRAPPIRFQYKLIETSHKVPLPLHLNAGPFGTLRGTDSIWLHDPDGVGASAIAIGIEVEIVVGERRHNRDILKGNDKTGIRKQAITNLRRWQRALDWMIQATPDISILPPPSIASNIALNEAETNIVTAIGAKTLRGWKTAKSAGYPFNFHFKTTLANLKKRGIIGNDGRGYFVVALSGQKSGHGQD